MTLSQELMELYKKNPGYYSGARSEMLRFFPEKAKRVLDVGCAEGNFGALLKQGAQCEVWGTDISAESIELAKTKLDKAMAGDIFDHLQLLPENYFDAIFFNDVLEHLVDPYTLLQRISSKVSNNGKVIATIPNILHFRTLKKLIINRDWEYEDSGILDKTHLRFFTEKSMVRMFVENGYEVESVTPINHTKSLRPYLMRLLSFGILPKDIYYLQYTVVARPKKNQYI